MITRSKINLFSIKLILVIFSNLLVINSSKLEFDVKNWTNAQRDQLFDRLDKNKDNCLSKTEFKPLLEQLFYSTKTEKTLVNDSNEEQIFDALNFTSVNKHMERDEFNWLWDDWIKVILKPKTALIVVDVQNDFMDQKNGSLPVKNGTDILPFINDLIEKVNFDTIVYTKDWHPPNHCSFIESAKKALLDHKIMNLSENSILKEGQTVYYKKHKDVPQSIWPSHCVQNTPGAELYEGLKKVGKAKDTFVITKGTDPDIDSYSAFEDNGGIHKTCLHKELQKRGITDVYLTGVLYEFCVGSTAVDALRRGYRTGFVENAIHEKFPNLRQNMRQKLIKMSANMIHSEDVSDYINGRERTVEMGIVLARKLYNPSLYNISTNCS